MKTTFDSSGLRVPEPEHPSPSPRSLADLRLFTMPLGGVDRLNFRTFDTITVLRADGEEVTDTVELRGHYLIERADPTSGDWRDASVDIAMREMSVSGVSEKFGRISASVNTAIGKESRGQVRPGAIYETSPYDSPKMCEMFGYMQFELLDAGVVVFNKDPIQLQHSITHIPPIGQGGGTREGADVPLYAANDPDGPPVAILRRVKTHIGAWLE